MWESPVHRAVTQANPTSPRAAGPVRVRLHFPVWLMAGLLVLGTLALYWPATGYKFVNFDDPVFLTENLHVQGGLNWEGIKWAFRNTKQASYWARSCGCRTCWLGSVLAGMPGDIT